MDDLKESVVLKKTDEYELIYERFYYDSQLIVKFNGHVLSKKLDFQTGALPERTMKESLAFLEICAKRFYGIKLNLGSGLTNQ